MTDGTDEPLASSRLAEELQQQGRRDELMRLVAARWMHLEDDPALLRRLVESLTPSEHDRYPQARVIATRTLPARLMSATDLHRALDATETLLADSPVMPSDVRLGLETAVALGLFSTGEFARAAASAARVRPLIDALVAQPEADLRLLGRASLHAGMIELLVGDVTAASRDLQRVPRWRDAYPSDAAGAAAELAFLAALSGDHPTARRWAEFADTQAGAWEGDGNRPGPHIALLVAQLLIAGDRLDWAEVDDLLSRLRTGRFAPSAHHYLTVYAGARTALVRGQPVQALQTLDDVEAWLDPPPIPPLARELMRAVEVEVAMSVDPPRAARLLPRRLTTWGEAVQRARWQMMQGYPDRAVDTLRLDVCARETGVRGQVYIKLSLSMALHRLGDLSGSADALHQALLLVSDLRSVAHVLALVDPAVLHNATGRSAVARAAETMLTGLSFASPPLVAGPVQPVSLTPRERVILHRLTKAGRVSDIAAEFTVSVYTIRNQIQRIYRKLDVNSRREAVHRADALGLLSTDDAERIVPTVDKEPRHPTTIHAPRRRHRATFDDSANDGVSPTA